MNLADFKKQISAFRVQVNNYRKTVLNSDYSLSRDNQMRLMEIQRALLNQTYGRLEKYIDKIGGGLGPTYLLAFGDGSHSEIANAISSAIQNIDRTIGRLTDMTEKDFADSFRREDEINETRLPKDTNIKLGVFEFITLVLFAICFTFIFAMTKILGLTFNWSALWPHLLFFFGVVFSITYIILPIVGVSRKVGTDVRDIYNEFVLEFRNKSKLSKFKTVLVIVIGVIGIIPAIRWIFIAIIKYIYS